MGAENHPNKLQGKDKTTTEVSAGRVVIQGKIRKNPKEEGVWSGENSA